MPGATGMPTPIYGQTFLCLSLALATAESIAAQMGVTDKAIEYHWQQICRRTGLRDVALLVHWSISKGLVKLREFK